MNIFESAVIYASLAGTFIALLFFAHRIAQKRTQKVHGFGVSSTRFFRRLTIGLTIISSVAITAAYWHIAGKYEYKKQIRAQSESLVKDHRNDIDQLYEELHHKHQTKLGREFASAEDLKNLIKALEASQERFTRAVYESSSRYVAKRAAQQRFKVDSPAHGTHFLQKRKSHRFLIRKKSNRSVCSDGKVLVVDIDKKQARCVKDDRVEITSDDLPLTTNDSDPPKPMVQGFGIENLHVVLNALAPVLYFFFILCGVLSRFYWERWLCLTEEDEADPVEALVFLRNRLAISSIIAVLVNFIIFEYLKDQYSEFTFKGVLLSFYNGFVWQALLKELSKGAVKVKGYVIPNLSDSQPKANETNNSG
jgi:hypothetical protein